MCVRETRGGALSVPINALDTIYKGTAIEEKEREKEREGGQHLNEIV